LKTRTAVTSRKSFLLNMAGPKHSQHLRMLTGINFPPDIASQDLRRIAFLRHTEAETETERCGTAASAVLAIYGRRGKDKDFSRLKTASGRLLGSDE